MEKDHTVQNLRIMYLDMLRIFAIFAMMILHASAANWSGSFANTFQWETFNVYDSLVRFCVPVFVMLSGVFFLDDRKPVNIKKLYQHNILRIVTAFVFWSFLYACFSLMIEIRVNGKSFDYALIKSFVLEFVSGHFHMWFLFAIVGLYIITPLLRKISADKKLTEYFLLLSFIFCYCVNVLKLTPLEGFVDDIMNKSRITFVLGYTGYYLLGHYLHRYQISKKLNNCINVMAILSIAITMVGTSMYSHALGEPRQELYSYLLPTTFFVSVSVFLCFKNLFSERQMKEKTNRLIGKVASLTFGMYLVHDFFNIFLRAIGLSTLALNPILSVPIIAIIVFFCSMIATYVISKIPILNKYIM